MLRSNRCLPFPPNPHPQPHMLRSNRRPAARRLLWRRHYQHLPGRRHERHAAHHCGQDAR
eukprot:172905-Chlamydomonas_euryale.AAC.10